MDEDQVNIPLYQTTWEVDREEGAYVNDLKASHTQPLVVPVIIEVPDDHKHHLAVTSVVA